MASIPALFTGTRRSSTRPGDTGGLQQGHGNDPLHGLQKVKIDDDVLERRHPKPRAGCRQRRGHAIDRAVPKRNTVG
jgi:hypothetical protein